MEYGKIEEHLVRVGDEFEPKMHAGGFLIRSYRIQRMLPAVSRNLKPNKHEHLDEHMHGGQNVLNMHTRKKKKPSPPWKIFTYAFSFGTTKPIQKRFPMYN